MYRRANIRAPSEDAQGNRSGRSANGAARTGKPLHESLTPRITIFLLIVFILVIFTRLTLFPQDPSATSFGAPRHGLLASSHKLVPRDYLNVSAHDPAPFPFCPIYGPGDELARRYTPAAMHKTVLHPGSNARVQRVINKAMRGLPVTISVLGGSISACHGAGDDPLASGCYPTQLFEWWNTVFPHPASELTNGARRRTDSSYFAYCNVQHLPDTTDLVVLEFDTEDP